MGEAERREIAVLVSEGGQSVDGDCELVDDHVETLAEKDEVCVVSDEAGSSAEAVCLV